MALYKSKQKIQRNVIVYVDGNYFSLSPSGVMYGQAFCLRENPSPHIRISEHDTSGACSQRSVFVFLWQ
jgi:hypothetical protein